MIRIDDYEQLTTRIVNWLKDYYWIHSGNIKAFVVGVSGGIDSAVVSTLCAKTELPTYVMTMPLHSKEENTELSELHAYGLVEKYSNVTLVNVDLTETYDKFMFWVDDTFTGNQLANANTKSRLRMVSLYQVAGAVGGIVVGTGNKVEDYGVGFFTKYGDGGVDIAPIADLYKSEVWELGEYLGVDQRIVDAKPTDGLWDDGRTDEDQIGVNYEQLEEAMEKGTGVGVDTLEHFNSKNQHKMKPIPTFKLNGGDRQYGF
jgi:NAD+ synthase